MLSRFQWERYRAGLGEGGIYYRAGNSIAFLIQSLDPLRELGRGKGIGGLPGLGAMRGGALGGACAIIGMVVRWGLSESQIKRITRIGRDGGLPY